MISRPSVIVCLILLCLPSCTRNVDSTHDAESEITPLEGEEATSAQVPESAPRQAMSPTGDQSRIEDDLDPFVDAMNLIYDNDVDAIAGLLESGLLPDLQEPWDLFSLLWIAASVGNPDMVRLFVDHGATIDLTDAQGNTPLMAAAGAGHDEVAAMLLAAGADVTLRTDSAYGRGLTALDYAAIGGRTSTVHLLMDWIAEHSTANLEAIVGDAYSIAEDRGQHETARLIAERAEELGVPLN
jgi:ankyrin repeat protein